MNDIAHIDGQLEWLRERLDSKGATRVLLASHVLSWVELTLANPKATPAMRAAAAKLKAICQRNLTTELPRSMAFMGLIYEMAGLYRDGQRHSAKLSRNRKSMELRDAICVVIAANPDLSADKVTRELYKPVALSDGQIVKIEEEPKTGLLIPVITAKTGEERRLAPVKDKLLRSYVTVARKLRKSANDGLVDG